MDRKDLFNENEQYFKALRWEQTISQTLYEILLVSSIQNKIKPVLNEQGYKRIVIYGLGKTGRAFLDLMKKNDIEVVCCIDKNKSIVLENTKVIHSLDELDCNADVIVVTVELEFNEIAQKIREVTDIPVVLIRDLLENVLLIPEKIK